MQFREPSVGGATLSKLFRGLDFICDILEDEAREVPGMEPALWKQRGKTAIPVGKYQLALENSSRFGADTLTVTEVPGFQYIRIHGGNTQFDTEGCLLPGERNGVCTVAHSQFNLQLLRDIVVPSLRAGEDVWLEILAPEVRA
jgi:hypothetical protein